MRFTRLRLENWRNFTSVDVPLAGRVFVVGANASGKSNLLDVFRFLKELAEDGGGLRNALDRKRRGLRAVRSLHARKTHVVVDVDAEIAGVTWGYRLRLGPAKPDGARVEEERVTRAGEVVLARPDADDQADPARLGRTAREQVNANKAFRPLAELFASIEYTHVVPQLVRSPGATQDRERFGEALGADFVEQIARTPKREQKRRLDGILRALRAVLPQLEALELDRDEVGRPHLRARYLHWRKPDAWQREDQLSDGTLRLLGLLWALSAGTSPLLLEEPELSLHPSAVRQLPRVLAAVAGDTGRQVLLSTHAPELLGDTGIEPAEVLLLRPTKDATQVVVGSDDPELCALAQADEPLGPLVEARTRPDGVLGLARFGRAR